MVIKIITVCGQKSKEKNSYIPPPPLQKKKKKEEREMPNWS